MDPMYSAQCLIVLIFDKRLNKDNNVDEKLEPRQDLKYASMTKIEIERHSITNAVGSLKFQNFRTSS